MLDRALNFLELLSRSFGIEGLVLDESSICCLEIPGRIEIQIEWDPAHGVILLAAPLSPPPEVGRERLFKGMLEANFLFRGTTGETLALDPESGRLMLCLQFDPGTVSSGGQEALFRNFMATGESWRKALQDYSQRDFASEQKSENIPFTMLKA
jgi:hypothetical protein